MTLAEVIYQKSLDLPDEKAQEVIDFIESLMSQTSEPQPQQQSEAGLEDMRRKAMERLSNVRLHWEGKPIPNRDEFYDDART